MGVHFFTILLVFGTSTLSYIAQGCYYDVLMPMIRSAVKKE